MSHYEALLVHGYNSPGFRDGPLVLVAHWGPHAATDRPDGPQKPSSHCLLDKLTDVVRLEDWPFPIAIIKQNTPWSSLSRHPWAMICAGLFT